MARRLRAVAVRLLLLLSSLALALLLAEGLVRVLWPQPPLTLRPELWVPDEGGLGHRLAANVDLVVNGGEGDVRFRTDEHGHRIGTPGPTSRPADLRVLALGDSFLEALAVDYEDTFPARLERGLGADLDATVVVANTGVSATAPHHYRARARHELGRGRFDVVLVSVFVGNDVVPRPLDRIPPRPPRREKGFRWPASAALPELVDAVVHPAWVGVRERSQLAVWLKIRLLPLLVRLGFSDHAFRPVFLRANASHPMFERTLDVLDDIAALARAAGADTLFLLIPPDYQVDREMGLAFARASGLAVEDVDLDQATERLRTGLEERGHAVVDATPSLRAAHATGRELYGRVDRHLSADGHAVVADALRTPLAAMLARRPMAGGGSG